MYFVIKLYHMRLNTYPHTHTHTPKRSNLDRKLEKQILLFSTLGIIYGVVAQKQINLLLNRWWWNGTNKRGYFEKVFPIIGKFQKIAFFALGSSPQQLSVIADLCLFFGAFQVYWRNYLSNAEELNPPFMERNNNSTNNQFDIE